MAALIEWTCIMLAKIIFKRMGSAMTNIVDDRLVELETRVAYQEDTLQQLNQIVTEQDKQLLRLQEHIRLLAEKLMSLEGGLEQISGATVSERPPHY